MNNKKGITLLSALIIVAVLSIFTGTIVISTDYIIDETDRKDFVREYKLVEAATKDYIMRNSGKIDFIEMEFDLSKASEESAEQFNDETITDNKIAMYIVDLDKIGVINANYGKQKNSDEEDVYLLSKTTNIVYYKKGFINNKNIYYRVMYD